MKITRRHLKRLLSENLLLEQNASTFPHFSANAAVVGDKIELTVTVGKQKNKTIEFELIDPKVTTDAYSKDSVKESIAQAVDIAIGSIPVEVYNTDSGTEMPLEDAIAMARSELRVAAGRHFRAAERVVIDSLKGTYDHENTYGGEKYNKVELRSAGDIKLTMDGEFVKKIDKADAFWLDWFRTNQSIRITEPEVNDNQGGSTSVNDNQGGSTSSASPKKKGLSRVAQLQKIIGDKTDGKWNRKTRGNTETDDKWKAWLGADQHRNFMAIMKLGLDKDADMSKEAFDSALERNSASDLATIAGYGKNLTGVLAMAKAIDAMSAEERHTAALAVHLFGEGETELAAEKGINKEEIIDNAFMEETDNIINGTAEAVNKIKSPEKKNKAIQNTVNFFKKKIEDAKSKSDQKALKDLDRKLKLFARKTEAEKLGIDMNLGGDPKEDLQESLSRGALYRRRYYGRY